MYTKQIEAFREHDRTFDRGSEPLVLLAGDSFIRFWDVEQNFPEWNTLNRGFGGAQVSDMLFYSNDVLRHRPDVLVFKCGANNLGRGKSTEDTLHELEYFWEELFKRWPDVTVLLLPELTGPHDFRFKEKQAVNRGLRQFASADERIFFVEGLSENVNDAEGRPRPELRLPDGHFNERGYRELSPAVRQRLQELLPN